MNVLPTLLSGIIYSMDDQSLERLENRIDTKAGSEELQRRPLYRTGDQAPRTWNMPQRTKKPFLGGFFSRLSPLEMLFAVSFLFFVAAGIIATTLIFTGGNTVSTKNVSVSVSGPNTIRAGDVVTLQIVITNQNAVPMNLTDLIVEFPQGTRSDSDVTVDLPRIRDSLGTINPGASVNRTVKAVMFGQAGQSADVQVSAEYRVPSSNAVFHSDTTYHATISQSPASITVDNLSDVVSGQPTDITVHVASNATENLSGMLLAVTYPPGFTFISASPKPVSGSTVWNLGDIEPGGTRTITIRGTFTGEDGDDRVIHFTTGTREAKNPSAIAAPLATTDTTLKVAKPFISVQIALNDNTSGAISAARGDVVHGEIRWTNNLPVRVQNVEIRVKLAGSILDKASVKTGQAFFSSSDSTLIFNSTSDPRLADVEPGDSEISAFQFSTLPPGQGGFQSPTVALTATVSGNRSSEGGVTNVVTSSASATVSVQTDLAVNATVIKVSGPIPPKVDQKTTYTITLAVTNSANAIANTVVSTVLPTYVTWEGNASSNVEYNPTGRTVTWTIGDMNAGAGQSASFQVSITPSLTQINSTPALLSDLRISAFDRFIRATVDRPGPAVTTQTSTSIQNGTVVP